MNKRILFGIAASAMILFGTQGFSTPKVKVTAPTLTFSGSGTSSLAATALNSTFTPAAISSMTDSIQADAQKQLNGFGSQKKLAEGFGNSNVYSAQSGTLQGYQGYKAFAVMGGLMVGAQLPTFDTSQMTAIATNMQKDPDVYAGIAASVTDINVGINAETVFGFFNKDLGKTLKNFYFNVKFGGLNTSYALDSSTDLTMASTNFGIGVNYQFLPATPSIMSGLLQWRGLNFGTGFNYQSNKIDFALTMSKITQEMKTNVSGTDVAATLAVTPKVNVGVVMNTFSIPLEATTSVQVLWLTNINFGVGADLVFGSSDVNATVNSPLTVDSITGLNALGVSYASTPGKATIDAGTKGISPSLVRARIMSGIGMNLGPVKIDIPVYYYFSSGLAFGLSAGFVW